MKLEYETKPILGVIVLHQVILEYKKGEIKVNLK
jgi:hypothetical protein